MAIVALLAPVLGVFGDFKGMRKKLFIAFMLVGVVSCVGLAVTPQLDFMTPGVAEKVGLAVLALYIPFHHRLCGRKPLLRQLFERRDQRGAHG